jgi:hypothetical protein
MGALPGGRSGLSSCFAAVASPMRRLICFGLNLNLGVVPPSLASMVDTEGASRPFHGERSGAQQLMAQPLHSGVFPFPQRALDLADCGRYITLPCGIASVTEPHKIIPYYRLSLCTSHFPYA